MRENELKVTPGQIHIIFSRGAGHVKTVHKVNSCCDQESGIIVVWD